MANAAKYTRASCGHMFAHYERAKDINGEYIKFGNQEIDSERSYLNYNLALHQQKQQGEFVKQRCGEVHCLNRKDVNVMCSWVVTQPKDFPAEQSKEFFEQTYKFLVNRYGKENVVSAYVHMDETTPHIHFAFVPVVPDKKKDRLTVSAKSCLSKTELSIFHKDMSKELNKHFCRDIGLHTEITAEQGGNQSIKQLKKIKEQKFVLESDVQALQLTRDQLSEILYTEPQNAINGVSVPFSKDKRIVSVNELNSLNELVKAVSVRDKEQQTISEQQEQLRKGLNAKAEELKEKENNLKTRENEIYKKEEKAEELLLLAEEATQTVEQYEQEKKQFYAENTPYIQQLIEQKDRTEEKCNQQEKTFYNINKENKAEKDKLMTKINELQIKIDEIKPLKEKNNNLNEQILALENQKQENNNKIDSLIKQYDEMQKELDRINKLYDTVWECAEYISDKTGIDFDKFVDKRIDGYRLNYILENGITK